jgi:hypothetical protein
MDKERIKKLARDPRFISGIYNYCDRWCERCPFTSHCLNYEMSEAEFADPETRDIKNKAFWNKMSDILRGTIEMLHEMAEEAGIDLDAVGQEEAARQEESRREKAKKNPGAIAAKEYIEQVDDWFDNVEELLEGKQGELLQKAELELPGSNPIGEAAEINDMAEIIRWYQHQIYVKLLRALQGREDEAQDEELWKEFPKDSDGSAKVALIGIDRSIAAWGNLRSHFPEQEAEILDTLVFLDRLRKEVEKEFPDARNFIRPGFDEPDKHAQGSE